MSRNAFAIEKLCVFFEDPQQAAAALPRFYAVPGVEVVQGSPKNVEVTAAGVDKGEALRALADRLGVPHESTLAVGDSENDRAIYHLSQRGVKFDLDSKNVKNGKTVACYMADEIAGFAFHLVQA